MRFEAVIFDWGGTLAEWSLVEFEEIWALAAQHLAPHMGESAVALQQRLAGVELDAWASMADEHRSFTFSDLVARASQALGVDVADALVEEASEHYLDSWLPHIVHDAEAAPVLAELRQRGLKTALLSNTHWPRHFHERMLERDGLGHLLDARLYTSELDYVKPHPEVFASALAAVEVREPERAIYVGDRLFDDVWGAQQSGLRAIHRHNEHVPPYDVIPDASITRLSEIPAILDAWERDGA
jgi:putative hydrolase of the HAD superfamily